MIQFSTKLRQFRIQHHMSQQDLAEALGLSQAAVASYEIGRREPDFKTIQLIADFFRVPMSALLPSSDEGEAFNTSVMAEVFAKNQKIRDLFNKIIYLSDSDLDTVCRVVDSISAKQ